MSDTPRRNYGEQDQSIAVLQSSSIELMLHILMRREEAFCAVRSVLTPAMLFDYSNYWFVLWSVLTAYYDANNHLPTYPILRVELRSFVGAYREGHLLDDDELKSLVLFCKKAFNVRASDLDPRWAVRTARKFLDERLLAQTKEALASDERRPGDLPAFLRDLHVASETISSLQDTATDLPFPANWCPTALNVQRTNLDFLDEFLGGGDAAGEVNTILGPTGSCKTTIALQIAAQRAQLYWEWARMHPNDPQYRVYVVPYESPVEPELRQRILMGHGVVLRSELEGCQTGWNSLSTSQTPKDYEQQLFRTKIATGRFRGERERIEDSMLILNSSLRFIDCSGADTAHPTRGGGFVDELAAILNNDLRANPNVRVGTVIIDYAGVMVTKHLARAGKDYSQLRHYLGNLPMQLRDRIALPMQSSVWLMHQLAGAANAKSPWAAMHHTDSQECKTLGDNCSFAFVLGNVDPNGHCIIRCTKHRRQPRHQQRIIRVEGALGRVKSTKGDYFYDEQRKQIVSVADAQKTNAELTASNRPAPVTARSQFRETDAFEN